ncbi:MAG TPA: DivIVA domain-containing protein [Acidimicrobiales bacterium]|jgi:DivIVA domain-containing protein|nr:DivIVA domain-containing protein [Acidimicrobiales bacterium]
MASSQSALDSLRTVEFRETLKGYHRDDVDEYLEKAAVEAEGLQEQLRQAGERLRQAGERISQLESAEPRPAPTAAAADAGQMDETLQRTLLLAQKFVDETKADAEARAAKLVAEAEAHARSVRSAAESNVAQITAESERRLREEVTRLEGIRVQLAGDVEAMARHLEGERQRLRAALTEVIKWVDDNVQPAATLAGRPSGSGGAGNAQPSGGERPAPGAGGGQSRPPGPDASQPAGARSMPKPGEPAQARPS